MSDNPLTLRQICLPCLVCHGTWQCCESWCACWQQVATAAHRRNATFTGFPVLGIRWQRMESHTLRHAYGMQPQQKGILVRHIQPTYETAKHLKPDDIIMKFDGVQVASDGTVPFR